MSEETKETLNDLLNVTNSIYDIYLKINFFISKKDNKAADIFIALFLDSLKSFKMQEDVIYSELEENPYLLVQIINLLSNKEKENFQNMNKVQRLCYRRIMNNLYLLLSLTNLDFLMLGENFFNNDPRCKFLLDNNIDLETSINFYRKFHFYYEKSISFRYITLINEEIKKTNNEQEIKDLIRIKLETSFIRGNELEDTLIESNFTSVSNDLKDEMSFNNSISPILFDDFTNIWTLYSIHANLVKLSKINKIDTTTKELIMEFKVFLLYISKKNINILKDKIIKMNFLTNEIKNILLKSIDSLDKDKIIHYSDDNKKVK